jgi:NADPH:quinone reductase-like Zn-dependent oxidoreductase
MRAPVCLQLAGPEKLEVRDIEAPMPGSGEIRIRVMAVAINFPMSRHRFRHIARSTR